MRRGEARRGASAATPATHLRRRFQAMLAPADVRLDGNRPWDPHIHDERLFQRVIVRGSLGLGEAYGSADRAAPVDGKAAANGERTARVDIPSVFRATPSDGSSRAASARYPTDDGSSRGESHTRVASRGVSSVRKSFSA